MVLAFHLAMKGQLQALKKNRVHVEFLSAGTDGLDGPTDAAGAVWRSRDVPGDFERAARCLEENNRSQELYFFSSHNLPSYEFWKEAGGLVTTGHTGTNVMDLQASDSLKL